MLALSLFHPGDLSKLRISHQYETEIARFANKSHQSLKTSDQQKGNSYDALRFD